MVSNVCQSGCLPAVFDSPAAFYLFVSARICSPFPQTLNLPAWVKKKMLNPSHLPPTSSVGQGCGPPSAQTGGTACPLFLARALFESQRVFCAVV